MKVMKHQNIHCYKDVYTLIFTKKYFLSISTGKECSKYFVDKKTYLSFSFNKKKKLSDTPRNSLCASNYKDLI